MNRLLLLLTVSLAFTGCYYDNEEDLYPASTTSTTSITDTTTIKYSTDIQPIISGNCAISSCHVSGAQVPDLSDYAKLKANIDRVQVRAIEQKSMPAAGPLSNANLAKLQKWIDAGALNN
jgi:hypothetical protein